MSKEIRDPLLTTEEAVTLLNISRRLFERFISEGKITPIRLSKRTRRFTRKQIMNFIRSHTRSNSKRKS